MRHQPLVLALLAAVLGVLVANGPAAAHSEYVTSTPAACAILPSAPSQVTVTVSEAVQTGTGSVRVTNAAGARFDRPNVTYSGDGRTLSVALASSGPGVYNVT
ncbi:MAG: copper resistance CopC family protein, partial [Thermoplasmata archaeon]